MITEQTKRLRRDLKEKFGGDVAAMAKDCKVDEKELRIILAGNCVKYTGPKACFNGLIFDVRTYILEKEGVQFECPVDGTRNETYVFSADEVEPYEIN